MKVPLALLLVAGCHSASPPDSAPEEMPTPTEHVAEAPLGVVFERLVVDRLFDSPLVSTDGSVALGVRRWSATGAALPAHGSVGSRRMVALAHDRVIDLATEDGATWLYVGRARVAVDHEFLGGSPIEVSPDATQLLLVEGREVVVRSAVTGAVIAQHRIDAGSERACWLDADHVAWIAQTKAGTQLRVAAVHGSIATTPLAQPATLAACDPAGGALALAVDGAVAILDLDTATEVARIAVDSETAVALGGRGSRLAVATDAGVTLYQRSGATLTRTFGYARSYERTPDLAFAPDGNRLAIAGDTLLMIGAAAPVPPVAVPSVDLPRGFRPSERVGDHWRYSQLPPVSGATALPAVFLHAETDTAHVIGLTIAHAELPPLPTDDAELAAELAAFGERVMAQWFTGWAVDDARTITTGRTDGMRWVEAREIHRDGCEPYDGFTRIVLATDRAYVVRALFQPGTSIAALPAFLDAPFRLPTLARRKGSRPGPC